MKIKAKKSLGQNFLKNNKIAQKMIEKAELKKGDIILEIGPGKGILTRELLKKDVVVLAIEKDKEMIKILKDKFIQEIKNKKLFLFEGDALKIDYHKLKLKNQQFTIITNLPYYITGKFLSNILTNNIQPKKMLLILQKEVVERIVAKNKKNSKLSFSVQVYGEPKYLMSISKNNFSPIPKVDSAILKISNISKNFFIQNKITENYFFEFLKLAFASKRKTLINNLSRKFEKQKTEKILSDLNINLNIRAEDLNLQQFLLIQSFF